MAPARRPDQNRHRLADGWQGSTVRAILENPRYTGYAFFGRWTKHETLIDPDDVAAGHVVRFRRSSPDRVVRSRQPAHPAIVTVEEFVETQLLRRSKAAGGLAAARKLERSRKTTKRPYPLRGRIGYCARRMEGTPRKARIYHRCSARSLVPGSSVLDTHPKNVYLAEAAVLGPLNTWLGDLFDRKNIDRTVEALVDSQGGARSEGCTQETAKKRLAEAEARLRRFQAAIAAGVDAEALVESINEAQAQRAAARAGLENIPAPNTLTTAEVHAIVDYLGDVGTALNQGDPAKLEDLYEALRLEMVYDPEARTVEVTIRPSGRGSECVRGGT